MLQQRGHTAAPAAVHGRTRVLTGWCPRVLGLALSCALHHCRADLPTVQPPTGKIGDYVCITRGRRNTRIPRGWLTQGLVIDYSKNRQRCERKGKIPNVKNGQMSDKAC